MNDSRGWNHRDYRSWRSHDQDRGVQAAIIRVAVANMDATYGDCVAAANRNNAVVKSFSTVNSISTDVTLGPSTQKPKRFGEVFGTCLFVFWRFLEGLFIVFPRMWHWDPQPRSRNDLVKFSAHVYLFLKVLGRSFFYDMGSKIQENWIRACL